MDQNTLSISLIPANESDLPIVYGWFDSAKSITDWGGPGMTFPMAADDFVRVTRIKEISSFKLLDAHESFLGFGQFYLRLERIHFGRIAVSPAHRGNGYGRTLMQKLMFESQMEFGSLDYSLFVMRDNFQAKTLYESLGFKLTTYPEAMEGVLADCDYMVCKQLAS